MIQKHKAPKSASTKKLNVIKEEKPIEFQQEFKKEHYTDNTPTWSGLMRSYINTLRTEPNGKMRDFVMEEIINMARVAEHMLNFIKKIL